MIFTQIIALLALLTLTRAHHNFLEIPQPPTCAIACGATECDSLQADYGNSECCPCFEFHRLIEQPPSWRNETSYSYCVKAKCSTTDYDDYFHKLEYLKDSGFYRCYGGGGGCGPVLDYTKTWPENEMIRIRLAKELDLKIGLGVAIPLLVILAACFLAYRFWWKPRRERKAILKMQRNAEADVELEQKLGVESEAAPAPVR